MAKGVEDTAFYRYHRLCRSTRSAASPAAFGLSRRRLPPRHGAARGAVAGRMLALSTHDTKRSEDVRARLAVLSEMPERVGGRRSPGGGSATTATGADGWPDRNTEYAALPDPGRRLAARRRPGWWPTWQKATREAKVHTSWARPGPGLRRGAASASCEARSATTSFVAERRRRFVAAHRSPAGPGQRRWPRRCCS